MTLHNPQNPRHARIFDLLRHGDPSIETSEEPDFRTGQDPKKTRAMDQDAVKRTALQSFARSEVGGLALKPGRNYKLF